MLIDLTLFPNLEYLIEQTFYTLVVILIMLSLRWITIRAIRRTQPDQIKQFAKRRMVTSAYVGVTVILLLMIWYESSAYIIAVAGVLTAGIAFALRDLLVDMIGWAYILWATPFKIGDRIEVGGQIGDVIDVTLIHFSILEVGNRIHGEQSTGRIVQIPNLQVFSLPFANYEKGFGFVWNEIVVPLTVESNWEKAKERIYDILTMHTKDCTEEAKAQLDSLERKSAIAFNNLTPIIYTELKDGKILLNIRYLCEPRRIRMTEHELWEAILHMVREEDDIKLG